eukprot:TRINITY_DN799_c3_g2_i1.p2 TRINITY_DN799_c3_g2~~TRINITY_DN799_c3_g2_i1.p2  ORF type:complete len:356 (-),score=120.21 TRINITY_DN799_c3_g2_i1:122-1189(-)
MASSPSRLPPPAKERRTGSCASPLARSCTPPPQRNEDEDDFEEEVVEEEEEEEAPRPCSAGEEVVVFVAGERFTRVRRSGRAPQLCKQMDRYGDEKFLMDDQGRMVCFFPNCDKRMSNNFSRHLAKHEKDQGCKRGHKRRGGTYISENAPASARAAAAAAASPSPKKLQSPRKSSSSRSRAVAGSLSPPMGSPPSGAVMPSPSPPLLLSVRDDFPALDAATRSSLSSKLCCAERNNHSHSMLRQELPPARSDVTSPLLQMLVNASLWAGPRNNLPASPPPPPPSPSLPRPARLQSPELFAAVSSLACTLRGCMKTPPPPSPSPSPSLAELCLSPPARPTPNVVQTLLELQRQRLL